MIVLIKFHEYLLGVFQKIVTKVLNPKRILNYCVIHFKNNFIEHTFSLCVEPNFLCKILNFLNVYFENNATIFQSCIF